jgi:hypothetical protein
MLELTGRELNPRATARTGALNERSQTNVESGATKHGSDDLRQ